MKTTEQYFPVVLFIMLYKVAVTFVSLDEMLVCDHSKYNVSKVLYIMQYEDCLGGSPCWICDLIP